MRSEKEKMLAGELYEPLDAELVRARERAGDWCQDLNATREKDQDARRRILIELFGQGGESVQGIRDGENLAEHGAILEWLEEEAAPVRPQLPGQMAGLAQNRSNPLAEWRVPHKSVSSGRVLGLVKSATTLSNSKAFQRGRFLPCWPFRLP